MKGIIASVLTATYTLGLGACLAKAQKWTGSVPLGDIARQLRIQREKSAKKPRVFTNEDLIALRAQADQSPSTEAGSVTTRSTAARAEEKPAKKTSAFQTGPESGHATPVDWGKATLGEEDYIDRMSKVRVVPPGQDNDAKTPPPTMKLANHLALSPDPPRPVQASQGATAPPAGEWAKAKFRIDSEMVSNDGKPVKPAVPAAQAKHDAAPPSPKEWAKARFHAVTGIIPPEPGPIAAPAIDLQPPPRESLGYVETANGRVEAIVAEGDHVGLIQETKAFVKNFHVPAPSQAEIEEALASPPPNHAHDMPPAQGAGQAEPNSSPQEANGSPLATGEAEVATGAQVAPPAGDNGGSQSEASATLQSQPLADYTGDQYRPKPPETVQPSNGPVPPAVAPEAGANRSSVQPIGYVEKAGGEKEAIVEFHDQVFLVHEGDLFADRFRVLRVSALSVEIVEEPTEASSAAILRRRRNTGEHPPDSR